MPVPQPYLALKNAVLRMGANLDVTHFTLSLGDQDSVTGWFQKGYTESTIEMLIVPKSRSYQFVGMGIHVRHDATGWTSTAVSEGDYIETANSEYYHILAVEKIPLGSTAIAYECDLALASPTQSGAISSTTVPYNSATGVVGATNYETGIAHFWRSGFLAESRYWLIYNTNTAIVYRTCKYGTWTEATNIATITPPSGGHDQHSIWWDGTYFHIVYSPDDDVSLVYRKGLPNSDGTITWSDTPQSVIGPITNHRYTFVGITVDSDGYPWISYEDENTGSNEESSCITKSSTKNGSWTTADNFPHILQTVSATSAAAAIIPLTSLNMAVIYGVPAQTAKCKIWNGSAWGDQETATTSTLTYAYSFSAVAISNDVFLFFRRANGDAIFVKRTSGVGWGAEETVSTDYGVEGGSIAVGTNNAVYCFWLNDACTIIYYRKRTSAGSWGAATLWINAASETYVWNICSFYQVQSGHIGLNYTTGADSPLTVKFAVLEDA